MDQGGATQSSWADRLQDTFNEMVNAQFETPEFKKHFGMPLTMARARFEAAQMRLYVMNRRDCWGYVQGKAPFAAKKVVWAHEMDELISDAREGIDHVELTSREAEVLGLTRAELENAKPIPGAQAAFYGWIHLSSELPWLGAMCVSHILERRNNSAVVRGGGGSERWRTKLVEELNIDPAKLINSNVHVEADLGHSSDLWTCIASYVVDERSYRDAMEGAVRSQVLDRAYRGAIADAMAEITD